MIWSHWRRKGNINNHGYRLLLGPAKWSHVEHTVMAQRTTHKPVTPEKRLSTSNGRRTHVRKNSWDIVTPKVKEIAAGVQAGERSRLAEAITLGGYTCRLSWHHWPVTWCRMTSLTSHMTLLTSHMSYDITDQSHDVLWHHWPVTCVLWHHRPVTCVLWHPDQSHVSYDITYQSQCHHWSVTPSCVYLNEDYKPHPVMAWASSLLYILALVDMSDLWPKPFYICSWKQASSEAQAGTMVVDEGALSPEQAATAGDPQTDTQDWVIRAPWCREVYADWCIWEASHKPRVQGSRLGEFGRELRNCQSEYKMCM